MVFLELKRRQQEIYYYHTKDNYEVDFVVKKGRNIQALIQVAYELDNVNTKNREIRALISAMEETKLNQGLVLTYDTKDEIKLDGKSILLVPTYEWLLR